MGDVRWPEVILLLGYAALAEVRLWRINRQTTVVRQDVEDTSSRLRDVEGAAAARLGEPLLRRSEDHDDEDQAQRPLRGR